MRQPQRVFTTEFKQQAVQLRETSGKSGTPIAHDLGISDTILYRWRKQMHLQGRSAFPGKGHQTELEDGHDPISWSLERVGRCQKLLKVYWALVAE